MIPKEYIVSSDSFEIWDVYEYKVILNNFDQTGRL